MEYPQDHFDIVLDKGMLDAVLSHGRIETGEDVVVQKVLSEVYRVLKPGGVYMIFSGNDSFIVNPYLYGEDFDWDLKVDRFTVKRPDNKSGKRTVFYYLLTKDL